MKRNNYKSVLINLKYFEKNIPLKREISSKKKDNKCGDTCKFSKIILILFLIYTFVNFNYFLNSMKIIKNYIWLNKNLKKRIIKTNLKIALCTMGKKENFYLLN